MFENAPKAFTDVVDGITVKELMDRYEVALDECGFHSFEMEINKARGTHRAIWGQERDREFVKGPGGSVREDMQRFCAKALMEQVGADVKLHIEVIPWMESRDAPEEFPKSQTLREWGYDQIYAWNKLEEILHAMVGVGDSPLDIPYLPYYGDLGKTKKLEKLDERYRSGKMSEETYLELKKRIGEQKG